MSEKMTIFFDFKEGGDDFQAPADQYTISLTRGDGKAMTQEEAMAVLLAFKLGKNDLQGGKKRKPRAAKSSKQGV